MITSKLNKGDTPSIEFQKKLPLWVSIYYKCIGLIVQPKFLIFCFSKNSHDFNFMIEKRKFTFQFFFLQYEEWRDRTSDLDIDNTNIFLK